MMNFLVRLLPLLEGLRDSSTEDHLEAIKEILTTSIFSFLPIFIGAGSVMLDADPEAEVGFVTAFLQVVGGGELVFYSCSILAPILYLVFREPSGEKHFKERMFQGVVVTAILVVTYILYGRIYNENVNNLELLVTWSYYLIVISLIMWYLATVFKNMMTKGPNLKDSENDFSKVYEMHRRA